MSKSLNLCAPVNNTGYGVAGYNILRVLKERAWDVSLFGRGTNERAHDAEANRLIQQCSARNEMFDYEAPCLNIWHQFDLASSIGRGKYVAYPFFELDGFTPREVHHMNYPDVLAVSSQWAKDVVLKHGILSEDRVSVVPLGVDTKVFNPTLVKDREEKNTIFLNCGKWEIRKGHDFLVDLFHAAFNTDDNVELWLLPFNPFLPPNDAANWENMYLDTPLGRAGKIKIWPWQQTHEGVAQIMAAATCGIFPSRAEGWNLELLEMMAIGKPVIATDYSAHTEFCNGSNCHLVSVPDDLVPAYDGRWFHEQGNWADMGEEQYDQIVAYMREVHMLAKSGPIVNEAGIATAREFTWDNSVDKIEQILA